MDFTFPDLGEGIAEGEIVRWHVQEGDVVEEDQVLVEVETDKALVEIPSPAAGRITRLPHGEGDRLEVGELLVQIEVESEGEQEPSEPADDEELSLDLSGRDSSTVVGSLSSEEEVLEPRAIEEEEAAPAQEDVLATPATRKLARSLGVDLRDVAGATGRDRVTKEDVQSFAGSESSTARKVPEEGPTERIQLSAVRRTIARRLTRSARNIPHAVHMDRVDVTELRKRVESSRHGDGDQRILTMTPYVIRALVSALQEYPRMNACLEDEETLRINHYYHIGVSVDTEHGLMVPVIRDADQKSLVEIADDIRDKARRARNREIELDEMRGGTFTLSNIGAIGGQFAQPIIHEPQVGILVTGRVESTPVASQKDVVVRRMMPLSLAFDHRVVDGADAARFLNHFRKKLRDPSDGMEEGG